MSQNSTSKTILVTGATGYVAGWVVKRLLEAGHTVHAAVRDPSDKARRAHLDALAEQLPGSIVYFQADLLKPGSYLEAMRNCEIVFHTASPFSTSVDDPQRDLVEPAVNGTRNVLESCNQTPGVRRVVLTSSCAAMYGDNADMASTHTGVFTEADWNTSSSVDHQPYSFSKTEAEKIAWDMAKQQDRWELVTVNPSLVLGPGIKPDATSESFSIMKQMADGTFKAGAPDYKIGIVDVRDVAEMHIRAAFEPQAKGRYITSGTDSDFMAVSNALRKTFGDAWPFPKRVLPKWLLWLVGPMANKALTRKVVTRNIGLPAAFDNSKSRTELGMSYRPLQTTVEDMFSQMVAAGTVK